MATSDMNGRGPGPSLTPLLWAMAAGAMMTGLYVLIIDWTVLLRWAKASIGHH